MIKWRQYLPLPLWLGRTRKPSIYVYHSQPNQLHAELNLDTWTVNNLPNRLLAQLFSQKAYIWRDSIAVWCWECSGLLMTSDNSVKKREVSQQAGWLAVTHRTVGSLGTRFSLQPLSGSAGSAYSFSSAGSFCSAGPAESRAGRTGSSTYCCFFGSWWPECSAAEEFEPSSGSAWSLRHSRIYYLSGWPLRRACFWTSRHLVVPRIPFERSQRVHE